MEKVTIELPEFIDVSRGGEKGKPETRQIVRVAFGNLNAEMIMQLVLHGVTQKVGDAAAGKTGADAKVAMEAVIESLGNGDWGRTRGDGTAEDPWMRYMRQILREKMTDATKAEYKALTPEDRDDFVNEKFAGLADDVQERVKAAAEKRMEIDRAAKADAKRAAKDAEITI